MFVCSPVQHGDQEKVDHRVTEIRRIAVEMVNVLEMVTEAVSVVVTEVVSVVAPNVEENGDVVVDLEIHSVLAR